MIKKTTFKISELVEFLNEVIAENGDCLVYYKNLPFLYYNFLTEAKDKASLNQRENFENIPEIFYKEVLNERD